MSRTVQRFTDVILDLNFKEGTNRQPKYRNYKAYNRPSKMSKRDRKKAKNKKNRQKNKKGGYFDQNYDSDDNNVSVSASQSKAKKVEDDPQKNWTILDYIVPEEVSLSHFLTHFDFRSNK